MRTNLVGKNHQTIIRFSSQYSSNTLSRMPHSVESKEIILPNSIRVAKEFQSSLSTKSQFDLESGMRGRTLRIRDSVYCEG